MREDDYQRLAPYVAALPADAALNVNTASAVVLSTLSDSLSLGAAEALVLQRQGAPFTDTAAFLAQPAMAGTTLQGTAIAVGSQFFRRPRKCTWAIGAWRWSACCSASRTAASVCSGATRPAAAPAPVIR